MARLVLLMVFVSLIAATALMLRSHNARSSEQQSAQSERLGHTVAILDDGSAMFAPDGTVTRELTDWLADPRPVTRRFELGGLQFAAGSVSPLPETAPRFVRLVHMLKSYPRVQVRIIGHARSSGDAAADLALSKARADAAAGELARNGIDRTRLSADGAGSTQAFRPVDSRDPRFSDRITLDLTAS